MQSDMITTGWLWFAAAGMVLILVAALVAYYFLRPRRKAENEIEEDHGTGDWIPTGRIDLTDPQAVGNFVLQAEETRVVESAGGVEHRQIRWRKATLDEARSVVKDYHAQRNLTMKANFTVVAETFGRRSVGETAHQEADGEKSKQVEKDRISDDNAA